MDLEAESFQTVTTQGFYIVTATWFVCLAANLLQLVPAGGIALDSADHAVVYASDKPNAAIWRLNMTASE